jgi:hypothetical protein
VGTLHAVDPDLWDVAYEYFGTPAVEWRTVGQKLKKMSIYELTRMFGIPYDGGAESDRKAFDVLREKFGEEGTMWE